MALAPQHLLSRKKVSVSSSSSPSMTEECCHKVFHVNDPKSIKIEIDFLRRKKKYIFLPPPPTEDLGRLRETGTLSAPVV